MADELNATPLSSPVDNVIESPPPTNNDSICLDQQQQHDNHHYHNHSDSTNHHPHKKQQSPPHVTSTQSQINSFEIQQLMSAPGPSNADQQCNKQPQQYLCTIIDHCSNPEGCMSILDILKSFNAPISEEQAWALIYQSVRLYRDACQRPDFSVQICRPPMSMKHLHVHKDGSVHISVDETGKCFIFTYLLHTHVSFSFSSYIM